MSFSHPSQVSATTGSDHHESVASAGPCATRQAITASRTTPTLCVLVIITGPSRKPDSSTQVVPVISPSPFCENQPAKTASWLALPRGRIAVTPVRTLSPEISVVSPTSTPFTSVMAFQVPGVPSNGTPKLRARGFSCPVTAEEKPAISRKAQQTVNRMTIVSSKKLSFQMPVEPAEGVFLHFDVELMRHIIETAGKAVAGAGLRINCGDPANRLLHAFRRKQPVAAALQHQ